MAEVERDQHILENKKVIEREIEKAEISKEDKIIEIGAGTGILTGKLAEKAGKVLAFEIDEKFKPELEKLKSQFKNLEIIYDNALNYNWKDYNKIVSNIPYSLSEPIIQKAIESETKTLVLVVSENFKNVLLSESKTGIITNLFFNIEVIEKINKENFFPIPRVDSCLVKLTRKDKEKSILHDILKRQGKIKNSLLYSLLEQGKTKKQAKEIIKNLSINKEILEKPVRKITGRFLILLKERLENLKLS